MWCYGDVKVRTSGSMIGTAHVRENKRHPGVIQVLQMGLTQSPPLPPQVHVV